MNSWKSLLFGIGVGVGAGSGLEDVGSCAGRFRIDLLQRAGGIVGSREWSRDRSGERRQRTESGAESDFSCLPNGLAEPLGESF